MDDCNQQFPLFRLPRDQIMRSQGSQANFTGKKAEDVIYCIAREFGYPAERGVYIGESIYEGHQIFADVVIRDVPSLNGRDLIVESKWQSSQGSADEKYPYLVKNIKERYPAPTIIVYGGGGAKAGAIAYLLGEVGGNLIGVFTLGEFQLWAINNL